MKALSSLAGLAVLGTVCSSGLAEPLGSHLWRFNEVFSNADGTIQFIELLECCGGPNEIFVEGKDIRSDTTGLEFIFPEDLPCSGCTANKHLLLATAAFAELPGAPTPDYIIPDNLFSLDSDTLRDWLYTPATMSWGDGDVPVDGVSSLSIDGSVTINSPTNFNDESGSIVIPCDPADLTLDGVVDVSDLLGVLAEWGPCGMSCPSADIDDDGSVDVTDLLAILGAWGPC